MRGADPLSFPKLIIISSVALFAVIGGMAVAKKWRSSTPSPIAKEAPLPKQKPSQNAPGSQKKSAPSALLVSSPSAKPQASGPLTPIPQNVIDPILPNIDRVFQLFTTGPSKLPIVETISYSSSVPWLKGKPAWIADYASYYSTSRHFIARSLNGKPDYFSQKVSSGSRFNVFRKDKHFYFYLLADLSRCKMGFYYIDQDTNERVHLKTYRIGVGRLDPQASSGCLTPTGKCLLGSKTAVYKPGVLGQYHDQKVELIRIFGSRWIPFEQAPSQSSDKTKGLGLQGMPWIQDSETKQWKENREALGYKSSGCIYVEDIEELFAIVVSKPTVVEIVRDCRDAALPGIEVSAPSR